MRMRTMVAIAATVALVFGACAEPDSELDDDLYGDDTGATIAEERAGNGQFLEWDEDADDFIDRDEFAVWWTDRSPALAWDVDGTTGLSRDEYTEGIYDIWDRNGDDRIDESEWRTGSDRFWRDDAYQASWTDWDNDGDSELDLNEVREAFERDGLYDRVDGDRDAIIDDEELADWFFDIFDANDDDRIDTTEWESTWFE